MNQLVGLKFFVFSGAVLVASGLLQIFLRPRGARENRLERLVNRSTIRALVFIAVGIAGILVGLGAVPIPRMSL